MSEIRRELEPIFREVFEKADLVLSDDISAEGIPAWDSLAHIDLIIAIEAHFGVKFAAAEISKLKAPGQNVGSLIALLAKKTGRT